MRIFAKQALALQADAQRKNMILIWVIFEQPRDFPNLLIARQFAIYDQGSKVRAPQPLDFHLQAATLAELHAQMPPDLFPMERSAGDAPQIIEIWL